ncbi:uncharacterized protein proca1 [Sphaeramia orbicularis]|uniref:uncharacterized protein proca1 n=1 Tax=Sphaeramia orbicularis TaxID=375764 RepID=UPI00117C4293|nr:protein PROCA1 [Sphaeramia orbicularis]
MWSVFFVFLSYLDRNFVRGDFLNLALDAEKQSKEMFTMLNGTLCAKMSTVGENFLYQVSDGAEVVRSVVSPTGKIVNCSVIVNQMQVKSFMHECRLGLKELKTGRQLDTRFVRMDEAKLMCREFKERSVRTERLRDDSESSAQQDKVVKRSKRGFTYPGTLWCGAGNMADHYGQLGDFAETDSCCRTHDHCPHVIHAFSSKYGYTNFKWHSICHCDCDNTLKDCLREVNDTSSRIVGQAFFNVIGVPCFEFTYEEQCAERHWYGLCKRYEKFPIAVLKEAVPYDFGGIDVIDELTIAPSKKKDSNKSSEQEKSETTTQSTVSGSQTSSPEEPSLRNVVTAAEDFIKVLATVSTSQSSTTDSEKGDAQSSEKKKRKNSGKKKKTSKKQKGKGKGRKRKQKAEAGVKIEDGATVSPPGSKAEEVIVLSNFISESHKHVQSSRNSNKVSESEYELGGKEETSNEVMKDEPAVDREAVSIMSSSPAQEKPAESDTDAKSLNTETASLSVSTTTSIIPVRAKTRRLRKGRRRKSKIVLSQSSDMVALDKTESVTKPTDHSTAISVPSIVTTMATTKPEQQGFVSNTERQPVVTTASTLIVITKLKRTRSKERKDREGKKKRRKGSSATPIVVPVHENSSTENLRTIHPGGAPTVPSVPFTEELVSHIPDIYRGRVSVQVTAPNSSFSVLKTKRQRSQERGLRNRRRKTALSLFNELPPFETSLENTVPILPIPQASNTLNSPTTTAAVSMSTEEVTTHREWSFSTTITTTPYVITKRHRQTIRQQRKQRKKPMSAAVSGRFSILEQAQHKPMTFTPLPSRTAATEELHLKRSERSNQSLCLTTSPTPILSPMQLSIERVKAQFSRKKRRKAALSARQQ